MQRKPLRLIRAFSAMSILAVLLLAACAPSTVGQPPTTPAAANTSLDIPPEVAGHEREWPLANHDYGNTRVAVGSSINSGNVANLKLAWTSPLKGTAEWGGGTGNPIIADGVVYFQDLAANTYAVERWVVVSARNRHETRGELLGHGQPIAGAWDQGLPERVQPAWAEPVHEFAGCVGPPHGEDAVVQPGATA